MPKQILKYELLPATEHQISLPIDGVIRHVAAVNEHLYMWIESGSVQSYLVRVWVYATGFEFDPSGKNYAGTAIMTGLVWHVYVQDDYDVGSRRTR